MNLEGLSLAELQELERLLLRLEQAENAPELPQPQVAPPVMRPAVKPASEPTERPRDLIDRICGEGSDKPSGKALGKGSWMG